MDTHPVTGQLSSLLPTILGWRRPGKIGSANIKNHPDGWFFMLAHAPHYFNILGGVYPPLPNPPHAGEVFCGSKWTPMAVTGQLSSLLRAILGRPTVQENKCCLRDWRRNVRWDADMRRNNAVCFKNSHTYRTVWEFFGFVNGLRQFYARYPRGS